MRGAIIGALSGCAVVVAERSASACSIGQRCDQFELAPKQGSVVPANVPALVVAKRFIGTLVALPGSVTLTVRLEKSGGVIVPTQVEPTQDAWLVRPLEPLEPGGTYAFTAKTACADFGDGPETAEASVTFSAGPTHALPAEAGSMSASYRITSEKNTAELAITPSPDLSAYLGVARFRTVVDGKEWGRSDFGSGPTSEDTGQVGVFTRLTAFCGGGFTDTCRGSTLSAASHRIEVFADLPGAPSPLAPLTSTVDLACPAPEPVDGGPPTGVGVPENRVSEAPRREAGGGCVVAASSERSKQLAQLATVLAAFLFGIRRRRA